MAHNRPAKRQHVRVGGADHDPVPFTDEFSAVHAHKARVICIGRESLSVPTEQLIQCEDDETWHSAPSWLPIDDPQYALDPYGEWYDEVLEGGVMDNFDNHSEAMAVKGKKHICSGVSVRPSPSYYEIRTHFFIVLTSCFLEDYSLSNLLGGGNPLGWAGGFLGGQRVPRLHLTGENNSWIASIPLSRVLPSFPHMQDVLCKAPSCPPSSLC